ncbi:hypothetical protein J2T57_001217 [Natronocella acetinitrilica]|uniref:Uncharacterized protein n=1 Tax=Natronocella acetinitrilica TaxID=414046 RepID=A0AAE3G1V0_9GAMM|nr:hypothetical protein [Natronocella acetinitrilica]
MGIGLARGRQRPTIDGLRRNAHMRAGQVAVRIDQVAQPDLAVVHLHEARLFLPQAHDARREHLLDLLSGILAPRLHHMFGEIKSDGAGSETLIKRIINRRNRATEAGTR